MLVNTYCKIPTSWPLQGLLFIFLILLLGCASANAPIQTSKSFQDPNLFQPESKVDIIKDNDSLIGQPLWFVPNLTETTTRLGFAKSLKREDLMCKNRFRPTKTVKMQILEKIARNGKKARLWHYYRVIFEDGSSRFIEVWRVEDKLSKHTSNTLTEKDLFMIRWELIDNGGLSLPEMFFKDDPVQIKRKIVKLENAIKTRQKEREARGGVLIGMTKAQVLSSSWDKPIEVNTTIVKGVVSEQWVYPGHNYLYFDNDRLTAIQTSK